MLILAEEPINELDDTAIIEEDKYSVNITKSRKKLFVDLQRNTCNSFLCTNSVKIQQSKAKDSEITPSRVWSRADLRSVYWFRGHLSSASQLKKDRKAKTNVLNKNVKL